MNKRFLTALLAAALCVGVFGVADARKLVTVNGVWRTSAANERGYVDSTTASINGAVQTVDTLYFDISDIAPDAGSVNTTAWGCMRLSFMAPTNTSVDTLFFATEPIIGGVAIPSTSFSNAIAVTAGDKVISAAITCDADAVIPNLAWVTSVRFRVRADGNTGAAFLASRAFLTFWAD